MYNPPCYKLKFYEKEFPSILRLIIYALNDRILLILIGASVVSLAIGIYEDYRDGTSMHWVEGASILFAVIIIVAFNAYNDYNRERQFRTLKHKVDERSVNIFQNGKITTISVTEVAAGDVLLLQPGVNFNYSLLIMVRILSQLMVYSLMEMT